MNFSQKNSLLLMVIGLIVTSFAQISMHFFQLSDFSFGLFSGVGLGLMLIALIIMQRNKKMAC